MVLDKEVPVVSVCVARNLVPVAVSALVLRVVRLLFTVNSPNSEELPEEWVLVSPITSLSTFVTLNSLLKVKRLP
jgi:hypothetical protein